MLWQSTLASASFMHAYATPGYVTGVHFDGLVVANSGGPAASGSSDMVRDASLFIGTEQNPRDDVSVANSVLYQTPGTFGGSLRAGYNTLGGSVSVTGSYLDNGGEGPRDRCPRHLASNG